MRLLKCSRSMLTKDDERHFSANALKSYPFRKSVLAATALIAAFL